MSSSFGRFSLAALCVLACTASSPSLSAQDRIATAVAMLGTPSALPQDGVPDILVATATNAGVVNLFSGAQGHAAIALGAPFGPSFPGGLRIAAGDVNGDDIADGVIATGPGGGLVRMYSGLDASIIGEGYPFGTASTGGIFVAVGDVDGDGHNDLIAAEGAGGRVRAYSVQDGGAVLADLTPYGSTFTGGVRVATGDVTGDGIDDLITAPATGPGAIKVYASAATLLGEIQPFSPTFIGGVFVAAGDLNGDGRADIVASSSTGAGRLQAFDGTDGRLLLDIGQGLPSGISVSTGDLDADGRADIIVGLGPGNSSTVGAITLGASTSDWSILFSFVADLTAPDGSAVPAETGIVVAAMTRTGIRYTSPDHATFEPGQSNTFTITTSASPAVTGITQTGTLPTGVTFVDNHDGTATLSGTPAIGTGGTYTSTLTAANSFDPPATQTFMLTVPCSAAISSTTFHQGAFGIPYVPVTFSQTGAPSGGIWSAAGLPSGLAIDPSTGVLNGTPTTTGLFTATFTYTAGASCRASTPPMTFSVVPVALIDTYDAEVGNTQIVAAAHSSPTTPHFSYAAGVLANDSGPALVVTAVTNATTLLGGQITIAANGAFTYTPAVGAKGVDHYVYTVTSNGVSSQTDIELVLGPRRVWYVDPSSSAGDGRSHSPFNSLSSVNGSEEVGDADDVGDYIYLYSGTHTGNFTTEPAQTLWGAGAAFTPRPGLAIPAGAPAIIAGSLQIVGNDVTISSVGVSARSGLSALSGSNLSGLTIKNDVTVAANGSVYGVAMQNVNSTPGGAPNFGINFRRVDVQNTQFGVFLDHVNQSAGSFTITGDGGTANNGSGGVMQTGSAAVFLQSAGNVTLGYLTTAGSPGGIVVEEGTGSYTIHHTDVSRSFGGLLVSNITASLDSLTVSSSRFAESLFQFFNTGNGIYIRTAQTGVVQHVTIEDSIFEDNPESGVLLEAEGTAVIAATIQGNSFRRNNTAGLTLTQTASSSTTYRVLGNDFQSQLRRVIDVRSQLSTPTGLLQLRIQGNTIGESGTFDSGSMVGEGIYVGMSGEGRNVILIDGNQLNEISSARAIAVERIFPATAQTQAADVTITSNTVTAPTGTNSAVTCAGPGVPCPKEAVVVQSDAGGTSFPSILNLDIHDNSAYNPGNFTFGTAGAYRLHVAGGGSLQVVGAGDATTQVTMTNTVIPPPGPTPIIVDPGVTVIPGPLVTPP